MMIMKSEAMALKLLLETDEDSFFNEIGEDEQVRTTNTILLSLSSAMYGKRFSLTKCFEKA